MRLTDLKPGDGVWIDHYGIHPGVVIEVDSTSAIVIVGTGTGRSHYVEVCVQPNSPMARALGLNKPTYFNATRVAIIQDCTSIARKTRRCPPGPFQDLVDLLEEFVKQRRISLAQAKTQARSTHSPDTHVVLCAKHEEPDS